MQTHEHFDPGCGDVNGVISCKEACAIQLGQGFVDGKWMDYAHMENGPDYFVQVPLPAYVLWNLLKVLAEFSICTGTRVLSSRVLLKFTLK